MSENITYSDGTIDGRPIAGWHMVQYGETQEYLESLQKEGYIMLYRESNPPEEGKLTISKPNPEFHLMKDTTDPNNYLYGPTMKPVPVDSDSFTPVSYVGVSEENNTVSTTETDTTVTKNLSERHLNGMVYFIRPGDTPEYLEELRKRGFFTVSFKIDEAVENEYANVVVTSIDTTTDPNNWADGPMYPVNWPESVDTTPQEYKLVLVEGEPGEPLKLVPVVDTTDITDPNNYLEGPLPQSELEKLEKLRINLDNAEWKLYKFTSDDFGKLIHYSESTDTTDNFDLPGGYVFTTEYTEEFEEKLKKAIELYFNTPARRDPDDTRVAFISTVDAETEAVTSVQVACADTDGWRTIGTLNPDGIDWKYNAGNLTGSGAPSVVWHAQELGALGVWTDGTDNWTGIEGWFDANWTMLGCGDFDDDGKDSVLMSLYGGLFYSVDLDGTLAALGSLNWSGWEFGAVGDFAGDGKADVVLYHKELGSVVLLADGNSDAWTSLGQIDGSDWAVAGAGDFNSDGIADLLVRQASTGLIGGYAGADMSKWSVVDSDAGYYLA